MESTNFDQDCVRLSENLELFENLKISGNNCIGIKLIQENQVLSNNFTHIFENSTMSIDLTDILKKKSYKHNKLNKHKFNNKYSPNNNPEDLEYQYKINLEEFNILESVKNADNTPKPTIFLMIGKTGTGKTYLSKQIISILSNENIFENIMIFASPPSKMEYIPILQSNQIDKISQKFSIKHMEKILQNQSNPNPKPLLLILDDIIYPILSSHKYEKFSEMLCNSRHYNIYTIVIMQFPIGLKQQIRMNFDIVFIFEDEMISNRKRIYEHYFGIIPQYKIFDKLMSTVCANYRTLVFDNTKPSTNFEDKVKFYKAQLINLKKTHPIELLGLINTNNNSANEKDKKNNKSKFISNQLEKPDEINLLKVNVVNNDFEEKNITKQSDNGQICLLVKSDIKQTQTLKPNIIIEKIKKNNKLIKKIVKQNEKLYELL